MTAFFKDLRQRTADISQPSGLDERDCFRRCKKDFKRLFFN